MGPGAGRVAMRLSVEVEGKEQLVTVEPLTGGSLIAVRWSGKTYEVDVSRLRPGRLSLIIPAAGHASHEVSGYEAASGDVVLRIAGCAVRARVSDGRHPQTAAAPAQIGGDHAVAAPMPGRLVRVLVAVGETVTAGQGLAVVEAMKMENEVSSPSAGVVTEVVADVGKSVETGTVLVVVRGVTDD